MIKVSFYPNNPLMLGQANFNPYLNQLPINPVIPNYQPVSSPVPRMQIDTVNGKDSAYAFTIGPNSSVILADATEPKVWLVTTDSSGYKMVKGFKIIPEEEPVQEPVVQTSADQITALMDRMNKLEERMNAYGESDARNVSSNESNSTNTQSNAGNGSGSKGSYDGNQSNRRK